jgi:hypothetical protein
LTEDPPSGGAHDRHIAGAGVTVPINCSECHVVPQSVGDPGHIDGAASISFGPLARTGGLSPTSCGATHCHGGFPGGNAANAPAWFAAREEACGTCHSLPPPTGQHERHVGEGIACTACHGDLLRTTHVNGIVNIGLETYSRPNRAFPGTCTQVCHHDGVAWFDE